MRSKISVSILILVCATRALAEDKPIENPVAGQFRMHLEHADRNEDGFVTKEELAAKLAADPSRAPETVGHIVSAMIDDLDNDHDGKLSKAEVAEGARRAGEKATTKEDGSRAQQLVDAIAEYKKKHDGAQPANLEDSRASTLFQKKPFVAFSLMVVKNLGATDRRLIQMP